MKAKRTNVCQWCGHQAATSTDHMVHVHEAHPDTIGRGRTMSKLWSCPRLGCGHDNPPVVDVCGRCGHENTLVAAQNAARSFVVCRRRPDGTVWRSIRCSAQTARFTVAAMTRLYALHGRDTSFDAARLEVVDDTGRLAWLEVADVTETSNYRKGQP